MPKPEVAEIIHLDLEGVGKPSIIPFAQSNPSGGSGSMVAGSRPDNLIAKKKRAMQKAITDAGSVKKVEELLELSLEMAKDKTLPGNTRTANIRLLLEYWAGPPELVQSGAEGGAGMHFHFEDTGDMVIAIQKREVAQKRIAKRV